MPVRIVVLGSCMLDLVARVERLPVPGETLFARSLEMHAGGKGLNQALAARRLGAEVTLIGRVGADAFGDRLIATLEQDGVDTTYVSRDPEAGTGLAIPMVLDDGANAIISAPRANMALPLGKVVRAAAVIAAADVLLLQFEAPMDCNIAAAFIAREGGARVLLNTAPVAECPVELLSVVTGIVANEVEAAALAPGLPEGATEQARAFLFVGGLEFAVVTLGDQGAVVANRHASRHVPAFTVPAVDTVGAGDAYCGALAVGLAEGRALFDAARFASAAGAVAVTRHGAAASLPSRADVNALLANES